MALPFRLKFIELDCLECFCYFFSLETRELPGKFRRPLLFVSSPDTCVVRTGEVYKVRVTIVFKPSVWRIGDSLRSGENNKFYIGVVLRADNGNSARNGLLRLFSTSKSKDLTLFFGVASV